MILLAGNLLQELGRGVELVDKCAIGRNLLLQLLNLCAKLTATRIRTHHIREGAYADKGGKDADGERYTQPEEFSKFALHR